MDSSWLRVTVVFCAPGVEDVSEVTLAPGSSVEDAIAAARLHARRPELKDPLDTGIWGRRCSLDQQVSAGDRVEIYRPLTIDPMEGRRVRANLRRRQRLKP
jgi:putative ubiquitin-RnfH superfamily antitoxin RatB of RatAB toxin-antitoxin module